MTANRWWVKAAARWLARIDGVKGQVQMFSLAVTAFSTFGVLLQGFGLGRYVPYLGVAGVAGLLVYTYYFTEGGVWNQMSRDRQDMSNNFASPNARVIAEMQTRGWGAVQKGRELTDEERAAIQDELDASFGELRDGVSVE